MFRGYRFGCSRSRRLGIGSITNNWRWTFDLEHAVRSKPEVNRGLDAWGFKRHSLSVES